jgi:hypothetical protein
LRGSTGSFPGEVRSLWEALLHFEEGESRIEDPSFFLLPEGRKDPEAELLEFIVRATKKPELICRFPARALFVRDILKVKLPRAQCPELEKFLNALRGDGLSIIFADSHMGSPASMFGHTFLRIYSSENNLYSFIVNFAARLEGDPGPIYAIKGLTGGYRGYFSVGPFFEKLREYGGIEGRDLWEYELNVDPFYLKLLKMHIYELEGVYSKYYFFQKNCSSEIFRLLKLAFPDKELELKTSWTVPLDTIRVLKRRGAVKRVRHHRSLQRRITEALNFLNEGDGSLLKKWVIGERGLPADRVAGFYDLAADYVRFLYYSGSLSRNRYAKLYLEALKKRRTAEGGGYGPLKNRSVSPDEGHGSQRLRTGWGYDSGKGGFYFISYRPVYHDLGDPPSGYRLGSEVVFSEIELRLYGQELLLERWKALGILSLERINPLIRPISWFVETGYARELDNEGIVGGYGFLRSGGGYTFGLGPFSLSILPEAKWLGFGRGEKLKAFVGLRTVFLLQSDSLSAGLDLSPGLYLVGNGREGSAVGTLWAGIHPVKNLSVKVSGKGTFFKKFRRVEGSVSVALYF